MNTNLLVKRHNLITETRGYYDRILTTSTERYNLLGVNEVYCNHDSSNGLDFFAP